MDVLERKVENQVQFWSLLGPFLILSSIAVLLFKVSVHWHFPLSALIGIPLCVKWKMKGLAAALSCLLLFSVIAYPKLELDERYWHIGMVLAMAFSFIVLTLSIEEVQHLIDKLQLESQSRLENFLRLDEQWKVAEQSWMNERERVNQEMGSLTEEMAKVQEDKQTFYKLAQLAKDELVQVRNQHDQLLQELFYKKQQVAQLNERIEEADLTIQGFVDSESEKQMRRLAERLAGLEEEKETLKAQLAIVQREWQREIQEAQQQLEKLEKRERDPETLPDLSDNTRSLEAIYLQLREQFQEKSALLDATRRELFQAQEKLLAWQKEHEEEQLYSQSEEEHNFEKELLLLGKDYEQMEWNYQQEIDELNRLVGHLLRQSFPGR